ncbi:MAG TPA: M1 family aminopeptidase [Burkholderiales bacterium]|nr:M1 family aminopeptidase [Burkholderiales bacterium]
MKRGIAGAALVATLMANAALAVPPLEPGVSRELARWRAKIYGDVRYDLALTLRPPVTKVEGRLELRLAVRGKPADLVLDWRPPEGGRLATVEANGTAIERPRIVHEHLVIPARHVRTGENVVRLAFESPVATASTAVTVYRDREDGAEYVYSLFVPSDASTVFPCFDQPDLKARFALALDVPQAWETVSNAPVIGVTPHETPTGEGAKRVAFRATEPISTYLFAFAAGPFEVLEEREDGVAPQPEARMLVRKSRLERARRASYEMFMLHRQAIDWFAGYFGFPFPFPKHDLVLVPEFPYGGMEHAGATFLREESVLFPFEPAAADRLRRVQLLFHETSHQWFGDLVTMRWFDDLWLKEGFANLMAAKATAAITPEYGAWNAFHQLKVAAYRTDATQGTTPIWQRLANLSAAKSAYGSIVYSKAPGVLRQAEFYLGADAFQRAVQGFVHSHAYGTADWGDLVRALEGASGRKLDAWAAAWVKRRGMPVVRTALRTGPDGRIARLTLAQTPALGGDGVWPMRTELFVAGDGPPRTHAVALEGRTASVPELAGAPAPRYVFANHGDYAYGRFVLDDASRTAVIANVSGVADPLLRALLLDALWDEVRDARLAPAAYIDLALAQAPRESDELTVASLVGRAQTALRWYLSDAQRADAAPRVEAAFADGMTDAADKGQRITYFRAFVGTATTAKARATLKGLLAGTREVPGVALSSRDRFRIVERLLALGDPEAEALLAAQSQADASDNGRRYAYAAAAARTDPAAKRRQFAGWLEDPALPESWIEESLAPFNTVEHERLTAPLVVTALAQLPKLKRERKIFFVNSWLAAFLGGQTSRETLATAKRFLRETKLDPDLRRKVLEQLDGLERTVRIRKKFA